MVERTESPPPHHTLEPLLAPREQLLWIGQPQQGLLLRRQDWLGIPLSLVWLAGTLYWEWIVLYYTFFNGDTAGIQPFLMIFLFVGALFILSGLYVTVGRFFWDRYLRTQTTYGLTNRRMIVYRRGIEPLHQSFDLRSLRNLRLEHHGKGFGSILIGSGNVASSMSMGGTLLIFERVGEAESVYKQIQGIL